MIRAAVALLVSVSLLGCFPHNPRARTYAKLGEGAALLAGIGVAAFAGTGADCDEMAAAGEDTSGCKTKAKVLSTIGVTLIVAGLLGFVATVSTAEEEPGPKPVEIKATPKPDQTPTTTQPTETGSAGSAAGSAAGSGATEPTPAPAQGSGSATPPPSP